MNFQIIAQVARYLNVSPNQIKRSEEWASVLFVQVQGFRPQFVSKRILVAVETFEEKMERLEKERDAEADKVEAIAHDIDKHLPISIDVPWAKLHSAAVDVYEGRSTLDQAIERFTSRKLIKRVK